MYYSLTCCEILQLLELGRRQLLPGEELFRPGSALGSRAVAQLAVIVVIVVVVVVEAVGLLGGVVRGGGLGAVGRRAGAHRPGGGHVGASER